MKTNFTICFVLMTSLLFAAERSHAGYITSHTDPESYFAATMSHDWVLGNFVGGKDDWTFTATNTRTNDVVRGDLTSYGQSGNSGFHTITVNESGSVSLRHNTSIHTSLAFNFTDIGNLTGDFIDSFFFHISPHDNSNDLQLEIKAKAMINGELVTETLYQQGGGFFGYTLDYGYFTEFVISVDYGKNNGGYVGLIVGLGDGGKNDFVESEPSAVPAPTTLVILGLGLAGLGLVRARRKK